MMMFFAPATILQTLFQSYFVTANRPSLGLALSVISGIVNVFLDAFFILKLNLGISGAALATGIGQMIPAIVGLYFFFFNQDELYFVKFKMNFGLLKEACYNGMSEMVSQLSGAVMTFLFSGFNITFFTALSNGKVSAIISFSRMFLFTCGAIIILSMIFKVIGTWLAVPVAEFLTCIVSLKYHQHYFLRNSAEYL